MDQTQERRWIRRAAAGIAILAGTGIVSALVWRGTSERGAGARREAASQAPASAPANRDVESRIAAFCGDCHGLPTPDRFPRDAWYGKVKRGYEFYAESGRNDLDPPPLELTAAYYRSRAPERGVYPEPPEAPQPLRVAFRVQRFLSPPQSQIPPCLANLRWTSLQPKSPPVLLACDMRTGTLTAVDLRDASSVPRVLAVLNNPCHVEPCDLDGDGSTDLIVADLGSQLADDHDRGQVVWLRSDPATGDYQKVVIAAGLGRVADAQPADVDGDGDQDLIVAEFGMYRTGGIHCLRNVATRGTPPRFESEELDPRPGPIHVPIHDFDGDGRPDFVALVSQEQECVDLFLNQGHGRFVSQNLWAAPDLTFGSSGLQLVDLDRDGDLDILYSNGDSFDNMYVTPQHGVQWIENQGDLRFAYHRVADLLGTYRALAGDLDGDGDSDILAVALLPRQLLPTHLADRPMTSIICLEQVTPGQFLRHHLEIGSPYYATCELADFDSDGDLDFAVGSQLANVEQLPYWLAVWWNQGLERKTP